MLVKTNLAQAFWASAKDFQRAFSREKGHPKEEPIAWVDRLLGDGLVVPDNAGRALTLLLTGPPGAGKSTFALELCHCARLEQPNHTPMPPRCLYVTTESNRELIRHQITSFGWKDMEVSSPKDKEDRKDTEKLKPLEVLEIQELGNFNWIKKMIGFLKGIKDIESPVGPAEQLGNEIVKKSIERDLSRSKSDIVVIDSLNVAPTEDRGHLFNVYQSLITSVECPRVLVLVLDTQDTAAGHEFWGYIADVIIRLDHRWVEGYMVRTLEIQKARYQAHAWGTHQFKVYGPQEPAAKLEERRLQHPFRQEGGTFVFPSIHFYLSKYKRSRHVAMGYVKTPFKELDHMLGGEGFLKGRCVALVGSRGSHKSHLGYLHVLEQLHEKESARALIISLRDDEFVAHATMKQILEDQVQGPRSIMDRLELMYFPPGYITPEEFFHRVYISIQRLRSAAADNDHEITVLFNSLDQLNARFPLCAREQIFVPGLIEMFCAEGITSIFIGVDEVLEPSEQYGLLAMADIIIKANREEQAFFDRDRVTDHSPREEIVVLRITRVAGGRPAGQGGALELVEEPGVPVRRKLTFRSLRAPRPAEDSRAPSSRDG